MSISVWGLCSCMSVWRALNRAYMWPCEYGMIPNAPIWWKTEYSGDLKSILHPFTILVELLSYNAEHRIKHCPIRDALIPKYIENESEERVFGILPNIKSWLNNRVESSQMMLV